MAGTPAHVEALEAFARCEPASARPSPARRPARSIGRSIDHLHFPARRPRRLPRPPRPARRSDAHRPPRLLRPRPLHSSRRLDERERVADGLVLDVVREIADTARVRHEWRLVSPAVASLLRASLLEHAKRDDDASAKAATATRQNEEGDEANEDDDAVVVGPPRPPAASREDDVEDILGSLAAFRRDPPFTIQRVCELALDPRAYYATFDKLKHAMEKLLMVTGTVESGLGDAVDAGGRRDGDREEDTRAAKRHKADPANAEQSAFVSSLIASRATTAAAAAAVAAAAAASGVGGGGGGAGTERAMEDLTSREEKNPRETTAREFENASAAAAADATAGDDGADAAEAARAAEAMSTSPKAGMVES